MFQRIMVPVDGSELSEAILPHASELARRLQIPLVLLTVLDPALVDISNIKDETEQYMNRLAHNLKMDGLEVEVLVSFGDAAEQIVEVVGSRQCDIIAMSTHGRTGWERIRLGSVTDKVIHSVEIPVMTIAPGRVSQSETLGETISRIVVLLDGSPLSETSLPMAGGLAKALSLELLLIRVITHGAMDAYHYLREIAEDMAHGGVKVSQKLLYGPPDRKIIEWMQESTGEIVMLTPHGRRGMSRAVYGSVSETLIRSLGRPILIIPPKQ